MSTDIARAEKSFFETNSSDLDKRDDELKRMREHLLRSVILELQLSIEALSRPPCNKYRSDNLPRVIAATGTTKEAADPILCVGGCLQTDGVAGLGG
jgi:hypothetical protein